MVAGLGREQVPKLRGKGYQLARKQGLNCWGGAGATSERLARVTEVTQMREDKSHSLQSAS